MSEPGTIVLPAAGASANQVSMSAITVLKWIGLLAMVVDHLRFIYGADVAILFSIGRLAYPIFAFVLAFHLSAAVRREDNAVLDRTCRRLLMFGCFAQPAYMLLLGDVVPLNILFTLAVSVMLIRLSSSWLFTPAFLILPFFTDYNWAGQMFFLISFYFCSAMAEQKYTWFMGALWVLGFALLSWMLNNPYVLAAMPLILGALVWKPRFSVARMQKFFYLFYPVHLYVLLGWVMLK